MGNPNDETRNQNQIRKSNDEWEGAHWTGRGARGVYV
jgi:hypothetical protein